MQTFSVTQLAKLNHPNACERCFWIGCRVKSMPYQIFPSVLQVFDKASKDAGLQMHRYGNSLYPDSWLRQATKGSDTAAMAKAQHWSQFKATIGEKHQIMVRGVPDDMFCTDNTWTIVDYKTSASIASDSWLPVYIAQLNLYRVIAEHHGFTPVERLALVYFTPQPKAEEIRAAMMSVQFYTTVIDVPVLPKLANRLADRAVQIGEETTPPAAHPDCRDCANLDQIMALLR